MSHLGELTSAYLDGELTATEEAKVVGHLERCGACRQDLADLHAARAAVRALPILDAPGWLLQPAAPTRARFMRRHPAGAAAVAAAILAFGIGLAGWLAPPPAVEMNLMDIATTHHARSVQDGVPTGSGVAQIAAVLEVAE